MREPSATPSGCSSSPSNAKEGWHYDLCYPGYMWADTENVWRAPGFEFSGSLNGHYYGYEPLESVVRSLRRLERTRESG